MVLTGSAVVFPWFRELVQRERWDAVRFLIARLSSALSLVRVHALCDALYPSWSVAVTTRASTHTTLSIPAAFLCVTHSSDVHTHHHCSGAAINQGWMLYMIWYVWFLSFLAHEVILGSASEWRQGILKWQNPLLFTMMTRCQPLDDGDLLVHFCWAKAYRFVVHLW